MAVYNYFDGFVRMSEKSKECAKFLNTELKSFNKSNLDEKVKELHSIEHASDEIKHEIMENLVREFLPPIEREDITTLTHCLDNVTDNIEEVLRNIYIFGVESITNEAIEFSELVIECVEALYQCIKELHNYKKSKTLKNLIISINTIEEKGDDLYLRVMKDLYLKDDAMYIIKWSEIYDRLEKCLDSCEIVAGEVETIILKNS